MNKGLLLFEQMLLRAYDRFNARDIDAALAVMHPEVDWPNGMEGGIEHGHPAVRSYWTRQWKVLNPSVHPLAFNSQVDGRIDAEVHQLVHDIGGSLLADQIIHHIYSFEDAMIKSMEIAKTDQ